MDLPGLLASKFIARKDVKASQQSNGDYMPVQHCEECGRGYCNHETPKIREGWKRSDLEAHLAGTSTFGHYLLNLEDQCKLFAFDIDLEPDGQFPFPYEMTGDPKTDPWDNDNNFRGEIQEFQPREAWLNRGHPARGWMKYQLRTVAHRLAAAIHSELEIPTAVAYTGAKGLHVYGFTGLMPAKDVREGAQIVIDAVGGMSPTRGQNFYIFDNRDPIEGQPNVKIEVFPKQDSLDGKDLGNLMRIPLGRNKKNPKDPTFFVDMSTSLMELRPIDPEHAMTTSNPFSASE